MTRTPFILAAVCGVALTAGALSAQTALRDVPRITEGLIAVGIAVEISDVCDDIDPRMLRGIGFLNGLKSHARSLGFTNAQIDAYTDDKAEQDRLEAIARKRLADKGAVPGQPSTYCAVGRAEMDTGSDIGRLLR